MQSTIEYDDEQHISIHLKRGEWAGHELEDINLVTNSDKSTSSGGWVENDYRLNLEDQPEAAAAAAAGCCGVLAKLDSPHSSRAHNSQQRRFPSRSDWGRGGVWKQRATTSNNEEEKKRHREKHEDRQSDGYVLDTGITGRSSADPPPPPPLEQLASYSCLVGLVR